MSNSEALDRHQFLRQLGFQGAALLALYCTGQSLSSCSQSASITPAPLPGAVTVDLTIASNAALKAVGGYVITNNIVVANTAQGYVAATVVCSHQGQRQIILQNGEFYCTAHGARYSLSGNGLNTNGSGGLTVYKVTQTGNMLTISLKANLKNAIQQLFNSLLVSTIRACT